jgi:predicted ATPase
VAEIVERADGVPLFVEELTKAVLETGGGDSATRAIGAAAPAGLAVPATLYASLLARLDRLGPAARRVAQIGAAIGREFSHEQLAAMAGPEGAELLALDQLVVAGFVFRRGTPPEATYAFKHALVQDAAYGTLLRSRRRHLHTRIARILQDQFPQTMAAKPELLAHHCTEAGLAEAAVGYWLAAARLALARSSTVEAIAQLGKGLDLLDTLREGTDRRRLELDLQTALGGALIAARGFAAPETGRAWVRARELCREVPGSPQLINVLYGQYVFHLVGAKLDAALGTAKELLRLAEEQQDALLRLMAHRAVGNTLVTMGELVEGGEHLERALALYSPGEQRRLALQHTFDPRVASLSYLSWALLILGYPELALRCSDDAVDHARELRHPNSQAQASFFNCLVHQLLGDREEARDRAAALVSLAMEQGFPYWLAAAQVVRGWSLTREDQSEEGLTLMQQGLAAYTATGARVLVPYFRSLIAMTWTSSASAENELADVLGQVDRSSERWLEPELHRFRGDLLLSISGSDPAEAEASFHHAMALARRRKMRLWELRAAMSLARCWRDRGKKVEVQNLLAPVYGCFTEGFETPDLIEARKLLDAV